METENCTGTTDNRRVCVTSMQGFNCKLLRGLQFSTSLNADLGVSESLEGVWKVGMSPIKKRYNSNEYVVSNYVAVTQS